MQICSYWCTNLLSSCIDNRTELQSNSFHYLQMYQHATDSLLTYLLTPCTRVLLEKLTGSQLVKKFPAFYGNRRFINPFTSVRHLSLSWASSVQSMPPHPTSWRSILILSSHLGLGLLSGFFPSGFPTKTLHTLLLSSIHAKCPAHLIFLDLVTRKILDERYRSLSSSLFRFLHSPVTSFLLNQNILRSTPFSYTLNLRSSLNVSDQVSYPYKTTGKIIVLYYYYYHCYYCHYNHHHAHTVLFLIYCAFVLADWWSALFV